MYVLYADDIISNSSSQTPKSWFCASAIPGDRDINCVLCVQPSAAVFGIVNVFVPVD